MSIRRLSGLTLSLVAFLMGVQGCGVQKLPDCVQGKAPTALVSKPAAGVVEVAVDGSGSMLGLTGSPQASRGWKALLKGVNLAAASNGVPIKAMRSGGELQAITNVAQAGDRCFFSGCGKYLPVSSSLDSLWKGKTSGLPIKVAISDLEVNEGEISGLVAAIKPHVQKGASIGVMAMKLPFMGKVYNSQSEVIHTGPSVRPVYLLATGPRTQLQSFLSDIRTKAALAGVPAQSIHLTFLDQHVSKPTLLAYTARGTPKNKARIGLDVFVGGKTYGRTANPEYQFASLPPQESGVLLGSTVSSKFTSAMPIDLSLVQVASVPLLHSSMDQATAVAAKEIQLQGNQLQIELGIPSNSRNGVIRATIPRGQLPEDWWISWNRSNQTIPDAKNQTDGLLLLMMSLGSLMVQPGSTPAAAFCLAYSR
jgi:hypothetical protein